MVVNILIASMSTYFRGSAQKIHFMCWKPLDIPKQWFFFSRGRWNWQTLTIACDFKQLLHGNYVTLPRVEITFLLRETEHLMFHVSFWKAPFCLYGYSFPLVYGTILILERRKKMHFIWHSSVNNDGFDYVFLLTKDSLIF